MAWLQQIGHYLQQAFTTLRGLSVVSIVLLVVAGLVVLRLTTGLLRLLVPVACCAGAGYLLIHTVLHLV
jgi:hypothetical protein